MTFSSQILFVPLAAALMLHRPGAVPHPTRAPAATGGGHATATFAGGCFWSMEHPFDQLEGVIAVTVGYMGGHTPHPTYEEVAVGRTGHAESVQIVYDSAKIGYAQLLDVFWHNIDPLTPDGQVCDFGSQYRTVIFYHNPTQHRSPRNRSAGLRRRGSSPSRSRPRSWRPASSTPRRSITSTSTARTRLGTPCTGSPAAATADCKSSGAGACRRQHPVPEGVGPKRSTP
jgi:methionine-S-sulfoxide reductase